MDSGKNSVGYSGHSPAQLKDGADSLPQTVRPAAKPAKKSRKRIEGQGEMLLPIAGKKKDAAKEVAKPAARRKAS